MCEFLAYAFHKICLSQSNKRTDSLQEKLYRNVVLLWSRSSAGKTFTVHRQKNHSPYIVLYNYTKKGFCRPPGLYIVGALAPILYKGNGLVSEMERRVVSAFLANGCSHTHGVRNVRV